MENIRPRLLGGLAGLSSALAGAGFLTRCPGGGCASCYGCAGVGAALVSIVVLNRLFRRQPPKAPARNAEGGP